MLMFFQQATGANAVVFFAHTIFMDAGSHVDAGVGAIAISIVQVLTTAFSAGIVDRAGRRILLLISQTLVTMCLVLIGLYFYLKSFGEEYGEQLGWLPLVGLCTFSMSFALGLGPLPWILMGELLPENVKGKNKDENRKV